MSQPRTEARASFTDAQRIQLVEMDLDKGDERFNKIAAEVAGFRKILTGILISMATASVLLALNLAVQIA